MMRDEKRAWIHACARRTTEVHVGHGEGFCLDSRLRAKDDRSPIEGGAAERRGVLLIKSPVEGGFRGMCVDSLLRKNDARGGINTSPVRFKHKAAGTAAVRTAGVSPASSPLLSRHGTGAE